MSYGINNEIYDEYAAPGYEMTDSELADGREDKTIKVAKNLYHNRKILFKLMSELYAEKSGASTGSQSLHSAKLTLLKAQIEYLKNPSPVLLEICESAKTTQQSTLGIFTLFKEKLGNERVRKLSDSFDKFVSDVGKASPMAQSKLATFIKKENGNGPIDIKEEENGNGPIDVNKKSVQPD